MAGLLGLLGSAAAAPAAAAPVAAGAVAAPAAAPVVAEGLAAAAPLAAETVAPAVADTLAPAAAEVIGKGAQGAKTAMGDIGSRLAADVGRAAGDKIAGDHAIQIPFLAGEGPTVAATPKSNPFVDMFRDELKQLDFKNDPGGALKKLQSMTGDPHPGVGRRPAPGNVSPQRQIRRPGVDWSATARLAEMRAVPRAFPR